MEWLTENPALMWLVIAVILLIIEAMTVALVTIWFVGGALVAMLLALARLPGYLQVIGFLVVSALLLYLARPLIRKKQSYQIRTNVDSLIGQSGIVTRSSSEFQNGQGKVAGQIWTIQHENSLPLTMDSTFVVLKVDGVKLIVRETQEKGE